MKKKIEIEIDVPDGWEFKSLSKAADGRYQIGEELTADYDLLVTFKKIKPAKKVIDLSCIVGSGIDCEFSQDDNNWNVIGGLREIRPDPYNQKGATLYDSAHKRSRLACRVRQSPHVHFWKGGDRCPLPDGLKVEAYSDDGDIYEIETGVDDANFWRNCRVFGVEVLGVAEGWRYEWEEE